MRKALAVGVICLASSLAFAVTQTPLKVKPGLWQIDMAVNYSGLPPNIQAMLDQMTAQQRHAMGLGATTTHKTCITEKQLNTQWVQGDENCKWTVLKSTSSDLDVQGTGCRAGKNEGMNTNVEVKIHVFDSEHVQGTMHGTGFGNGLHTTLDGKYMGKWIGATCHADMN